MLESLGKKLGENYTPETRTSVWELSRGSLCGRVQALGLCLGDTGLEMLIVSASCTGTDTG